MRGTACNVNTSFFILELALLCCRHGMSPSDPSYRASSSVADSARLFILKASYALPLSLIAQTTALPLGTVREHCQEEEFFTKSLPIFLCLPCFLAFLISAPLPHFFQFAVFLSAPLFHFTLWTLSPLPFTSPQRYSPIHSLQLPSTPYSSHLLFRALLLPTASAHSPN